jgi:hypothetical protein
MITNEQIKRRVVFMSRDVKRYLVNMDCSLEYECDAYDYVNRHPNDACEEDLNDLGKALREYLLANPELVEA